MTFEFDKQTINDLEIFRSKESGNSIFSLFNHTKTMGGENYLFSLMNSPLNDLEVLVKRTNTLKYIADYKFELNINSSQLDLIEHYLKLGIPPLKRNPIDAVFKSLSYRIKPTNNYYLILSGINFLKELLFLVKKELSPLLQQDLPELLGNKIRVLNDFADHRDFDGLYNREGEIKFLSLHKFDHLFRKKHKNELLDFIKILHELDAYLSIGKAANLNNLNFPEYLDSNQPTISITELFHPLLTNPVPCGVDLQYPKNLFFVTGPNMAGKSTFMKSFAIAMYLSHLGFPVPAKAMKTTVYNGIITTINIADNINKGYSHFYSEVRRVKEVALKLQENNKLFVIFDELFRGTNVKDAMDGSSAIIQSFSRIKKSTFCISTHITEVADQLKNEQGIAFKYFNSELIDGNPTYDYQLKNGVSHERLGMHIINKEGVIGMLDEMTDVS